MYIYGYQYRVASSNSNPKSRNFMNVIIAGASQGLGLSLCRVYLKNNSQAVVLGTYRTDINTDMADLAQEFPDRIYWQKLNVETEESFLNLKQAVMNLGWTHLHRVINCIGALQIEGLVAERRVEEVTLENLTKSFLVNSSPTLLLAKYLKDLFKHKEYGVFAAISAKVASISDNSLGGWYSYRASKTALNMIIKNLSLEFKRLGQDKYVITIHPGTTQTRLSEPFMKAAEKKYKIHTPLESAENIYNVIENLKPENQGQFLNYDNTTLPW